VVEGSQLTLIYSPQPSQAPGNENAGPEFKVLLVGDCGVGKTSLTRRHSTGEFASRAVWRSRLNIEVTPLKFMTTCGYMTFNVWDTGGQERFGGLRDGYYCDGQCAIIMFDVTSRITYKNVPQWYRDIRRVCGAIPVVLTGNKVDVADRQVKPKNVRFHRRRGLQYYDLSVLSMYNLEKPFLWLARRLSGQNTLEFIAPPARQPQVLINPALVTQHEQELGEAERVAIDDSEGL